MGAVGEGEAAAVVHLEEVSFEVAAAGVPELFHDGDVFFAVFVAAGVVGVAGPEAHLGVFGFLPSGDDVHAEASAADAVDGYGHAGGEGGGHGEDANGGEELDTGGDGGEAGHEGEGFEVVVPELGGSSEAAELDHGEGEVEAEAFGFFDDGAVEREGGHVLGGCGGDQPAIVADGEEDAEEEGGLGWLG